MPDVRNIKEYDEPGKKPGYLFIVPWGLEFVGGVNSVVRNLYAELLLRCEFKPLIITHDWNSAKLVDCGIDGIEAFNLRLQGLPADVSLFSKHALSYFFHRPGIRKIILGFLKKYDVRVVNVHFPGFYVEHFSYLKQNQLHDFKYIVSFHGSDVVNAETNKENAARMRKLLSVADAVIAPSKELSDRVADLMPELSTKLYVVYNGVSASRFGRYAKTALDLPQKIQNKKIALNVAAFRKVKAQDILLHAWKKVVDSHPDYYLLMVGAEGDFLSEVSDMVTTLGLKENAGILLNVTHDQVAALMALSQIVLLPSRSEGMPLVLIEAGLLGKPIIASKVGGIPELIRHMENGLFVEPEDADELSKAITQLVDNESLRAALGERLQSTVLEGFTWETACDQYMKIVSMKKTAV